MRTAALLFAIAACAAAQDFSEVAVERFATGFRFVEGPVWSRDGYLVFSDVPTNRVLKAVPGSAPEAFRRTAGRPHGNALDERGRLYTCESSARRISRAGAKGEYEMVADTFEGKRLNSPNDIVIRRDGHLWFTDPAFGAMDDTRELPFYGVYHLTPRGELTAVWRGNTRPNGIALAPNGRILYVSNSDERSIRAWDLDRGGNATAERVVISGIDGVPGGIRTDEKGNIYVACRGVAIYTPEGKSLAVIQIPETPSNLAFGDANNQGLYITARTSIYHIEMPVKGALP